ncbi:MAG: hypothetical protein OXU23_01060 [Candidatus Poribacteria bacterium]|nr:hypothetical protein [Candidatus Poribacteria bacterium]MDE0465579.1 hypothetical protein [Candidatus Poribacteria bacterium]
MDNQEFQKLVLNWMERVDARIGRVETRLGSLEQDVSWIKGKMESRSESSSMHRANLALGISIVGIGSLIGLIISWVK